MELRPSPESIKQHVGGKVDVSVSVFARVKFSDFTVFTVCHTEKEMAKHSLSAVLFLYINEL